MPQHDLFDKIPTWIKVAAGLGVLFIAPLVFLSIWFAGTRGGITAVLVIVVYFSTLYIVGVRRYIGEDK